MRDQASEVVLVVVSGLGVGSKRLDAWLEKLGVTIRTGLLQKEANKNATEPAIHLSKLSYYDNDYVTAESGALETRR